MAYNYLLLGENVRHIRKSKNMTIKQLAERIASSESSLRAVETGHRYFSIQRLCTTANIFKVSLDDLLKENKNDNELNEDRVPYKASPYDELLDSLDEASDSEIHFLVTVLKALKKHTKNSGVIGEINLMNDL